LKNEIIKTKNNIPIIRNKISIFESDISLLKRLNKDLDDEILKLKKDISELTNENVIIRGKNEIYKTRLNDLKFQASNFENIKKFSNHIDGIKSNYIRISHIESLKDNFLNHEFETIYNGLLRISDENFIDNSVKYINYWSFVIKHVKNNFEEINEKYLKNQLLLHHNFFSNINDASIEAEKISLDGKQRYSTVMDSDNNLIIAGAGSGKTLTIVSKIKYLIEKKKINPNEIFVFSFSRASVNDIKEKIKEFNIKDYNDINIFTFHKKGRDILKEEFKDFSFKTAEQWELKKLVRDFFGKLVKGEEIKEILEFFAYLFPLNLNNTSNGYGSLAELAELQKNMDLETIKSKYRNKSKETLKGEEVKSVEELLIANFLFLNGVEYEYESLYNPLKILKSTKIDENELKDYMNLDKDLFVKFNKIEYYCDYLDYVYPNEFGKLLKNFRKSIYKWENEENWVKYHRPDFFLVDYNIYLEHFGIDEDGKVRWLPKFSGKKYVKQMNDKREIHKKYGTKLLETYSYYRDEKLLEKLKEILLDNNIEFKDVNYSDIYRGLIERDNIDSNFSEIIKVIVSFINLFKGNGFKKRDFIEFHELNEKTELKILKDKNRFLLNNIEKIHELYQEHLKKNRKIDFNDMINDATELIKSKGINETCKYLIIDEFQDISFTRKEFIKSIQEKTGASVTVVGDDWQSIYRFTGSDLSLFTDFEKDFPYHQELFINKTYRNSQNLINLAGGFIEKNPKQIRKDLIADGKIENIEKPVKFYYSYGDKYQNNNLKILKTIIDDILRSFPSKNILILGRNSFDIDNLFKNEENNEYGLTLIGKDKSDKKIRYIAPDNKIIIINYSTIHSSKGLQEDNIILINLSDSIYGIPNKIENDPILDFVSLKPEEYPYAEERRLFYVGLTRTKNNVYCIVPEINASIFINEIKEDFGEYIEDVYSENKVMLNPNCPKCKEGKLLIRISGEGNKFIGCSNYPTCNFNAPDVKYLENMLICPECDEGILIDLESKYENSKGFVGCTNYEKGNGCTNTYSNQTLKKLVKKCPKCETGFLVKRNGRNGEFYGCTNYSKRICNHTENIPKIN